MKRFFGSIWFARVMMLLIGFTLFLGGLRRLLEGGLHYTNYWGGLVFAPLAMLFGAAVIAYTFLRWRTLHEKTRSKPLRGRAARKARQAEATKFPIDEYRKW